MKFTITDFEMTENHETIDRIMGDSSGYIEWEGKIVTDKRVVKFRLKKTWSTDNGGETVEILTPKPKDLSDDEWDELETEIIEHVENEYRKNRQEWEAVE